MAVANAPPERWRTFAAGAVSGTVTGALLQPLDVIRTHAQGAVFRSQRPQGIMATARAIMAEDGVAGLYKGIGPTVARVCLGAGLYFTILTELSSMARAAGLAKHPQPLPAPVPAAGTAGVGAGPAQAEHQPDGQARAALPLAPLPASMNFAIGASARCIAAALLNPLALVKTRMEWSRRGGSPYKGAFSAVVSIARTEGVRGMLSGLGPTIMRDAPFSGIYLTTFRLARRALRVDGEAAAVGGPGPDIVDMLPLPLRTFTAALIGGAVATVIVHPADTIRTRLQLRSAPFLQQQPQTAGAPLVRAGIAKELKLVWQEGGLASLFAGAGARVAKRTMSTAITWTLFEEGLRRSSRR
ncbi:hypothetical protein FNF29_03769 [Cafeteria roenbergensis]|uniref:Solute carrier family 25 member 38 homolog n=1 Tax=Cafeteria roenbergensis TaxID=33653 RepID=A0A5A8CHM1_CAFRO|nr:hypothetical protein FNF29_03769 [Cafeteria roenbergensis]|eukprot:KAA0152542.1 hypothetical protein FNF29_03769 [Cafeteria roenbergensis]